MKRSSAKFAFVAVVVLLWSYFLVPIDEHVSGQTTAPRLTAKLTPDTITLDGKLDEQSWSTAPELTVTVSGGGSSYPTSVRMKALYDKDYLYLSAIWTDTPQTSGVTRPGESVYHWIYWSNWITTGGDDGFVVQWKDTAEGSTNPKDLWAWSAGKTNYLNYADDLNLDYSNPSTPKILNDTFTTSIITYRPNSQNYEDGNDSTIPFTNDYPKYKTTGDGTDQRFIVQGTEVPLPANYTPADNSEIYAAYIIRKPDASRADVSAKGNWSNNAWTLEIKRKLNTGNMDDVQFSDLTKIYKFSIAVQENSPKFPIMVGEPGFASSGEIELEFHIPDFAATDIRISDSHPTIGDTIEIRANVTNAGGASTPFEIGFVLDGTILIHNITIQSLGELVQIPVNYTWIANNVSHGLHTISVVPDYGNRIAERREENNNATTTINFYVNLTGIKFSKKNPTEGDKIKIIVTITNPSQADAQNVQLVFFDGRKEIKGGNVTVPLVPGNSSIEFNISWKPSQGDHRVTVLVYQSSHSSIKKSISVAKPSPGFEIHLLITSIALALIVSYIMRRRY